MTSAQRLHFFYSLSNTVEVGLKPFNGLLDRLLQRRELEIGQILAHLSIGRSLFELAVGPRRVEEDLSLLVGFE